MIVVLSLLVIYIGSIVFIRQRCAVHFKLKRQLSDFSTFMVLFNLPAYFLSKVPTTPHIDKSHFPSLKALEDNWQDIQAEALALYDSGHITVKDDLPASSFYKDGRWTSFYLKLYDNDIPSARELAPKTLALIEKVPEMRMALFACLNPGKKINNHHDPFAYTLRYSLGLSTPNNDDCGLIVNGIDYKWADGESIIFDETYFHNAYNRTDTPRIILMTDIERPLSLGFIQRAYYWFGWIFNRIFAIDNIDNSNIGIGNTLGLGLTAYKDFLKKFKHWNKPLYVASKMLLIGLILYWLVDGLL